MFKKIKSVLLNNHSSKQTLFKNTFWLGQIEFFSKIILFFVTILIVRSFGPNNFGKFNLAFSYTSIIMILSDFGLNTVVTREIAKHPALIGKYLSNILSLKIAVSILICIISLIIRPFLNGDPFIQKLFILCVVYNLVQNILNLLLAVFSGMEKMEYVFISRLIYYFGLLFSAILITINHSTPDKLLLLYIIFTTITLISTFVLVFINKIKISLEFDFDFTKRLLIEALPLFGLAVVSAIYANNDTILIGHYFGSEKVGFYQSAYKIFFAFQSVNVVSSALFPRFSALIHQKNFVSLHKLMRLVIILSLCGLIPLAIIITIFANPIVNLIYGLAYINTSAVMVLLIWSGVILYFRNLYCNLLIAANRQKFVLYSLLFGTTINFLINFIVMPRFNYVYASLSILISEIVILICTTLFYAKSAKNML